MSITLSLCWYFKTTEFNEANLKGYVTTRISNQTKQQKAIAKGQKLSEYQKITMSTRTTSDSVQCLRLSNSSITREVMQILSEKVHNHLV